MFTLLEFLLFLYSRFCDLKNIDDIGLLAIFSGVSCFSRHTLLKAKTSCEKNMQYC